MDRRALFLALALFGCAPKPTEPKVVVLPPGLGRTAEVTPPKPSETKPSETKPAPTPAKKTAVVPSPAKPAPSPVSPLRPSASASATMTAPAPPPMPKADESHPLGYRIEGSGAIELEGVCRFGENEVACWDPKGKDAPDLARQIQDHLKTGSGGYDEALSVRFGRKNRLVVVRTEQPTGISARDRKGLSLQTVGDDPRQYGGMFSLGNSSGGGMANQPFVSHEVRFVAADPQAKTTRMRVMVSETIPDPPEIELRPGATATLAGCRFTVASIRKGAPSGGQPFGPDAGDVWTVLLTQTGKPSRPATFAVQDYGRLYLDAKGAVVGRDAYDKWIREAQRKGGFDFSKSPFRPVQISGYAMGPEPGMTVTMNADPKSVRTVRLFGAYRRTVDVTGIPLDPK